MMPPSITERQRNLRQCARASHNGHIFIPLLAGRLKITAEKQYITQLTQFFSNNTRMRYISSADCRVAGNMYSQTR